MQNDREATKTDGRYIVADVNISLIQFYEDGMTAEHWIIAFCAAY